MVECRVGLAFRLSLLLIGLTLHRAVLVAGGDTDEGSGSGDQSILQSPSQNNSIDQQEVITGANRQESTDLSRCIPVSNATREFLVFDVCIKYIQNDKLFLYDYGIDYQQLKQDLLLLNAALGTSTSATPYCMDVIRAYTCNYVYPGCSNETGMPQGICKEECEMYVLTDICRGEFRTLASVTNTVQRLTFMRQCDDTLLLLRDYGINSSAIDHSDCFNITETVTTPPDPVEMIDNNIMVTSLQATEPDAMSSTTSSISKLLAALLSSVSILFLSVLALTIIIMNVWKAKKAKGKSLNPFESHTITNDYLSQWKDGNHHDNEGVRHGLFQLSEEDVHAFLKDDELRKAIVPMDHLYLTGELGEGAFGRVFKGLLVTEDPSEDSGRRITQIAIKTVKDTEGMYRELKAFIEESVLMCSFNHPHVLGMVGICLDTVQSPYLLLPYMENGDLRTFLRNKRDTSKSSDTSYPEGLDYNILVRMCVEVSSGMEYLASKKLVHRDLAARNCMVNKDLTVKVADFGLARVIYHTDYYRQQQQTKVPVKWMAPESLHDMISTEKSDVWSYGVVCWEVFSLGRLPYPTLANHEVVDYLERGNRLKKPALCTDIIYEVMLNCWHDNAEKRPTFSEIVSHYHDGVLPGTFKVDDGGEYVLLGPEEGNVYKEQRDRSDTILSNTSIMDITIINQDRNGTPSAGNGTTFDVVFLCPGGLGVSETEEGAEYYMDMNSVPREGSVFVNRAAELHEYDDIAEGLGECRSEADSHVIYSNDHVTYSNDHVTHTPNECRSNELNSNGEYIVMQSADPALPDIQN